MAVRYPARPPPRIETPGPRPGGGEIEPEEAEKDGDGAAVDDRPEAQGSRHQEVGDRHLARQHERDGAGEKAQQEERAAERLEDAGQSYLGEQRSGAPAGGIPIGKANSFIVPNWMNMNAATIRSTLRSCGLHDDHVAIRSATTDGFAATCFSIIGTLFSRGPRSLGRPRVMGGGRSPVSSSCSNLACDSTTGASRPPQSLPRRRPSTGVTVPVQAGSG